MLLIKSSFPFHKIYAVFDILFLSFTRFLISYRLGREGGGRDGGK